MEELLDFLLMRLDESGFAQLLAHEPRLMAVSYWDSTPGNRWGPHLVQFTGCATCSQIPPRVVVNPVTGAELVLWRVIDVRAYLERHDRANHELESWGRYLDLSVEAWPCRQVRSLTLPFADDPGHHDKWRPEYAAFASGQLVQSHS
ncbi:hypothetical protein ACFOY2_26905 [Nonomuraea purpurea]|uniref:Uncharacterized protein n=1 Tax=Nonomuraea purpurea TaxID=1849276 RepID=A0ABV8GD05_9ACTN